MKLLLKLSLAALLFLVDFGYFLKSSITLCLLDIVFGLLIIVLLM